MRLLEDRGSAVAEFAVAMPAVMLVLGILLGGMQLGAVQLRAQDAAADAARSWARGDSGGVVFSHLQRQLPGARLSRAGPGDMICATVTARARGPVAALGLTVSAAACALAGGR